METVRKRVIVCRFWLQIFIESFGVDAMTILVKNLNSVQYKLKSLLFIPRDEKSTFQHRFSSLTASATRAVFWPPFWCQKGLFWHRVAKALFAPEDRFVTWNPLETFFQSYIPCNLDFSKHVTFDIRNGKSCFFKLHM